MVVFIGRMCSYSSALLFLLLALLNATGNAHKPLVSIPGGAIISGYLDSGTEQFLGIPFGQDTSGANRFAPPKPATVVPGFKIDGTVQGSACPQSVDPHSFLPYLNSNVTLQSEDCLNLRIARPAGTTSRSALPVMVFLYGGGFTTGQIYDKFYTPEGFVRQSAQSGQPVVYVAVNYRLSIFGFANSQTLFDQKSLNVGLRDQRLALEWVRANIAHFGGDPDKVTLFGQSAGAFSVGLQVTAFGGKRPVAFTRAILQGGAPQSNLGATGSVSSQRFAAVSSLLNCTIGTADSPATLDCMRALPLNTLLSTELAYASLVMPPAGGRAFTPVVDGDFIPDAPSSLVATGQFAPNVSIIQGWNENDGSLYTPLSITNETGVLRFLKTLAPGLTNSSLSTALQYYPITDFTPLNSSSTSAQFFRGARMMRDIVFTCPAIRFAEAVARKGSDAYLYNLNQTAFARRFAAANEEYLGVSHYSDIPYVFNSVSLVSPPDSPLASDIRLALKFSDSWSAFASTGSSCGRGQSICHWPKAFSSREYGVEATVQVIGGPDAGPKELMETGGKGPFSTENLWERCAFIQRIQSEFRV